MAQAGKNESVMTAEQPKEKKARKVRSLDERLKGASEEKLRERHKKATAELKAIAAEAKRRMTKKTDLNDLV